MARSLVDTNILVGVVLSEDFQHGREIEGVVFVNPFREA